jgi:hypothetical protein
MDNLWNPPEPRQGLAGEWDKFVGPGQTRGELWLILIPSLAAGLLVPAYAVIAKLGWSFFQLIVAGVMACDLMGGVITNATTAAKRWYHRHDQNCQKHLAFIAVHAVHLALAAWFFRGLDWTYFLVFYVYLLAASLIITRLRISLQRPVALLLYVGVVIISIYGFPPVRGMEWFIPVFYLKLLVSHLPKEVPFANT